MSEHLCIAFVPLFNHLSQEAQQKIMALTNHHTYKKNELIFQPGDEKLVIVAEGSMKVYQLLSNGKEHLLRIVHTGDYEGDQQLFDITNDRLFGQALENTKICTLSKQAFHQVLLENPPIALKLLELSAQKTAQLEKQAQFLSMERVEERLAHYLLNNSSNQSTLTLPMKMKDLALYLGTTPETLSRKFKYLEEKQYIKRSGKHITLLDPDGLEDL